MTVRPSVDERRRVAITAAEFTRTTPIDDTIGQERPRVQRTLYFYTRPRATRPYKTVIVQSSHADAARVSRCRPIFGHFKTFFIVFVFSFRLHFVSSFNVNDKPFNTDIRLWDVSRARYMYCFAFDDSYGIHFTSHKSYTHIDELINRQRSTHYECFLFIFQLATNSPSCLESIQAPTRRAMCANQFASIGVG